MSSKTLSNKELQDHYDQIFAIYGTRGWARLQDDLEVAIAHHNSLADVATLEQLWFRKGQLDQMLWLQSHQASHEAAYAALLAEQEGSAVVAGTEGRAQVVE